MDEKVGHEEATLNALAHLYEALCECERLMIPNETIARVMMQSTPNARKIAEYIVAHTLK